MTDPFDTVREGLRHVDRTTGADFPTRNIARTDALAALTSIEERLAASERNLCNCRELLKQALDAERMAR